MKADERTKLEEVYNDLRQARIRIGEVAERHPRTAQADMSDAYLCAREALNTVGEMVGRDYHHQEDGFDEFFKVGAWA